MGRFSQYNAKDWSAQFGGVFITGFGEEMITGAKDEELFSSSVGAQGDAIMNEINNDLGTISINVQATSPSVPYLKQCAKAGTIAPLWCNNLKLGETIGGEIARIKNYAEIAAAQEAEDLTFEFQVYDYTVK